LRRDAAHKHATTTATTIKQSSAAALAISAMKAVVSVTSVGSTSASSVPDVDAADVDATDDDIIDDDVDVRDSSVVSENDNVTSDDCVDSSSDDDCVDGGSVENALGAVVNFCTVVGGGDGRGVLVDVKPVTVAVDDVGIFVKLVVVKKSTTLDVSCTVATFENTGTPGSSGMIKVSVTSSNWHTSRRRNDHLAPLPMTRTLSA
jgi:hypothetical protein